MSWFAFSKLLC